MNKKFLWVTIISILILSAAGCAPSGKSPVDQGVIQLTDALGRSVELAEPPQNIVVTGRATQLLINTLYLFPEAKEQVAHVEYRSQTSHLFLPLVDPLAKQKADLEKDSGAEQIAPLKPDIVLMKSYLKTDLGDPIEQLGIKVFYMDLETPEAFFSEVEMLGKLFGNPQRSQQIVQYYQERIQKVEEGVKDIAADQRPEVLILQYSQKGGEVAFSVPPVEWLQTRMVETAGGQPVWRDISASGGWTVVSLEQIAAWNPEFLFIVDYSGSAPQVVADLQQNDSWKSLPVMAAGKVYPFPCDFSSWDQPDSRWILGQSWLAKVLHPEAFSDLDVRAETAAFYTQMYGLSVDQIEAEVMPLLADEPLFFAE
jgi:iron complex transport system substrate-binding protein